MPAYRKYDNPADDQHLADGDRLWRGVNMRLDPGSLAESYVSEAQNFRFNRGVAEPRKGVRKLAWSNVNITDHESVRPLGVVHGSGEFRDPTTDLEWQLVAAAGKVYRMREGITAAEVPLPAGVTLTGDVAFTQCMNVVVMHRGEDETNLVMDDIDEGFTSVVQSGAGDGTEPIPNAASGLFLQNRLWIPNGDLISVSDYLDYTRYAPATAQYYIEKGDGDTLVGLYKFNDTTLLAFKTRSVHVIGNLLPDDTGGYSAAFQDRIINDYGCKARRSIVQVGSDVWFLADQRGVVSIRQTETNKLQGVDVPISEAIEPLIRRIDWLHAENACAAFWDNKVYFAVPLDSPRKYGPELDPAKNYASWRMSFAIAVAQGGTYFFEIGANEEKLVNGTEELTVSGYFVAQSNIVAVHGLAAGTETSFSLKQVWVGYNNAVLVYDTLNQAWCGYDYGDAIMVDSWLRFNYANQLRLGFLSYEGYLNLYEDGFLDEHGQADLSIAKQSIATRLVTRGYLGAASGQKRFRRARLSVSTWWPSYLVSGRVDGVEELQAFSSAITRDRTKYFTHNTLDYETDNSNDDFFAPYREDYSVVLAAAPDELYIGSDGINPDQHQESRQGCLVQREGRYMQVIVEGTRGRAEIRSVEIEAVPGHRRSGIIA